MSEEIKVNLGAGTCAHINTADRSISFSKYGVFHKPAYLEYSDISKIHAALNPVPAPNVAQLEKADTRETETVPDWIKTHQTLDELVKWKLSQTSLKEDYYHAVENEIRTACKIWGDFQKAIGKHEQSQHTATAIAEKESIISAMNMQVRSMEDQLDDKDTRIKDLEAQRDKWYYEHENEVNNRVALEECLHPENEKLQAGIAEYKEKVAALEAEIKRLKNG